MPVRVRDAFLALLLLGAGALQPPDLSAQTILNVERLQPRDVAGWHASVQGAASLSGGNSEFTDLTGGAVVGHRWQPHWLRLFGGAEYRAQQGLRARNNRFAQLRYSYEISPRWQTFHFVQAQHNERLLLRERTLLGTGLRHSFIEGERTRLETGSGVMYERERLDPERLDPEEAAVARVWRMTNVLVASHHFRDDLRLVGVVYLQPDLAAPADYRLLSDLSLLVGLGRYVNLSLRVDWRHDSRPPAALRADDYLFTTGLVLTLR